MRNWNSTDFTPWYGIVENMINEGLVAVNGFIELPIVNVEVELNDFNDLVNHDFQEVLFSVHLGRVNK